MNASTAELDLAAIDQMPRLDPPLRRLLKEVRISIDTVHLSVEDRTDLIESFRRFTAELSKPEPRPDRLWRFWSRVDDLAPTVGHELARADPIQQLSSLNGFGIQPRGGFLHEAAAAELVQTIADPRIRTALGMAYRQMVQLSSREGVRPEGTFDLLYFYKLLASLLKSSEFTIRAPQIT
jgi:hypothetical protein